MTFIKFSVLSSLKQEFQSALYIRKMKRNKDKIFKDKKKYLNSSLLFFKQCFFNLGKNFDLPFFLDLVKYP